LHVETFPQLNPCLDCGVDEEVVKADAAGSVESGDAIYRED
jgi:hypothetical protein